MRFSLKTLLLAVPAVIFCLYLWDVVEVTKADGGRDVLVELDGLDNEQIASVKYAAVRSRDIDDIITNYPYMETVFRNVTQNQVSVRVSWSSTTSASGRLLHYGETPDAIMFLQQRDCIYRSRNIWGLQLRCDPSSRFRPQFVVARPIWQTLTPLQ